MGVIFFEKKLLKNLAGKKKVHTFAVLLEARRALSSAGSERLPYKQRVGGSNPSAPTPQRGVSISLTHLSFLPSRHISTVADANTGGLEE